MERSARYERKEIQILCPTSIQRCLLRHEHMYMLQHNNSGLRIGVSVIKQPIGSLWGA